MKIILLRFLLLLFSCLYSKCGDINIRERRKLNSGKIYNNNKPFIINLFLIISFLVFIT
jgi:hypothetical protein